MSLPASAAGLKSAENIAVYIDAIPGKKFDHPTQHAAVDQRNMLFAPHTLVVLRGTTVDFLNGDSVAHNVFWPSISGNKALRHNMTIVSPTQKKSFEFGASFREIGRAAGKAAARALAGQDLPDTIYPERTETVVNSRTAAQLGVTVSSDAVKKADRVLP